MENDQHNLFGFERLQVWQRSISFAGVLYELTKSFPKEEMFGLISQLRRAGVSVPANIAEGSSRSSKKDEARFLEIAYGSLCEIVTMLQIAAEQCFITKEQLATLRSEIYELCCMLSGFRRSVLEKAKLEKANE